MQKVLVPVLILAAVALSSSNVIPVAPINELKTEPLNYNYQENDNTFSSKHQSRNRLNAIKFNLDVESEIDKIPADYADNNEDFNRIGKDNIYNVKGFRKEQWHNYPRQLDRLNKYFYQHQSADKRNIDPDDPGNTYADESESDNHENVDDAIFNEYNPVNERHVYTNNNEAEIAAAVIDPLLIFRIHLACYNKNKAENQHTRLDTVEVHNERLEDIIKDVNSFSNELNPGSNQIKVKREGKINSEDLDAMHEPTGNPTVNKRIFALFSRLQSLSPKGHQLHHRRHMYAMYGPPDSEGGVLTAETRATFMRPPGSPLRWG